MTDRRYQKDIIILVADKNTKFAVQGLLSRYNSLQIRQITSDIFIHPGNDPGCLLHSHVFLRPFINQYAFSLVVFDREGCGQEHLSCKRLESDVEKLLSQNGWATRNTAIVIDPELEIWVWSDSPHVDEILGWSGRQPNLRTWLIQKSRLTTPHAKPDRPKEATEEALREARMPRSSSIYQQLAEKVSLGRCVDPAFIKLKTLLQSRFPLV